jgi:hypothetical protein
MLRQQKLGTMLARHRVAAVAAAGACFLGLFSCGGSGRQVTIERTINTVSNPEFAAVEARHEAAFAKFGESANRVERAAIIGALHSYYSALAEGQFERGCLLLSRKASARVANTRSGDSGEIEQSCGKRLGEVLARTLGERNERSQFAVASAKDVRLKGNEGYVVFTSVATPGVQEVLSVMREGGSWRLTSAVALPVQYATPSALVP